MGRKGKEDAELWIGYCAFHMGDYKKAMSVYESLRHSKSPNESVAVNLGCCYFYLGMYPESEKVKAILNYII